MSNNNENWLTLYEAYKKIDDLREKCDNENDKDSLSSLKEINEYLEQTEEKLQNIGINMAILNLNDSNFEEKVLKNTNIVLCDFWAEWCGPCKQISPILEELVRRITRK